MSPTSPSAPKSANGRDFGRGTLRGTCDRKRTNVPLCRKERDKEAPNGERDCSWQFVVAVVVVAERGEIEFGLSCRWRVDALARKAPVNLVVHARPRLDPEAREVTIAHGGERLAEPRCLRAGGLVAEHAAEEIALEGERDEVAGAHVGAAEALLPGAEESAP